jgi:hypothetical protein
MSYIKRLYEEKHYKKSRSGLPYLEFRSPLSPRNIEALGPGIIKLYEGSAVRDLAERGLELEACCLGLEACRLKLESLGA